MLRMVALSLLSLVFLLPFYILTRNALLAETEIQAPHWLWLPPAPQFSNFVAVFNNPEAPLASGLRNSAIIAVTTLVFQMLISSMAGYALARIPARASIGGGVEVLRWSVQQQHFR